jgi:alkylresorcinol/alkylpyrone synthase
MHFSESELPIDRLLEVFSNSGIEERYFAVPMDWYEQERTFLDKNEQYIKSACELGEQASRECLKAANCDPDEIDYLVFVSTTGLATPSVDARLINLLSLRNNIRRTPIWGLGCAGGAAGLAHAYHYLLGHPQDRVLLVAVELCGLTFQQNDFSKSNFVATALFGDGAAAVLLSGDEADADGIEIIDTNSTFWPDSLDVMGWNFMNSGMQVVFSRNIPRIVEQRARANFEEFLGKNSLSLAEIEHFIFHPGGAKVIEAYQQSLALSNGKLDICRDMLRRYGNMSSVSVLFVLAEHMRRYSDSGALGLISALGPGFCSESLLVRFSERG